MLIYPNSIRKNKKNVKGKKCRKSNKGTKTKSGTEAKQKEIYNQNKKEG